MTLLIAGRDYICVDSVSTFSGIPMINRKLHKWDEESVYATCGDSIRAACLMQALVADNDNRMSSEKILEISKNDLGFYVAGDAVHYFSCYGVYPVLENITLGSLQSPFARMARKRGPDANTFLDWPPQILEIMRDVMILEYPSLMTAGSVYASSATRADGWVIQNHRI